MARTKPTVISTTKISKLKINAYAKVNLTLEVLGKRADGYHALRSIVAMISLHDEITLEKANETTSDTGYPDDLCVKAANLLQVGAKISVKKMIPVGGGLGGGSADAAAVLLGLNELYALGKTREELAALGAKIGSDIPSLVLGGFVLMEGRGEIVTRLVEFDEKPPLYMVLANPGVFCSTKEVYSACKPSLREDGEILYNIKKSLESGEIAKLASALMNDLESPAKALHPEIVKTMEALKAAGVEGVLMSGSGSTVFGLVPNECRGQEIAALMNKAGYRSECVHTIVR